MSQIIVFNLVTIDGFYSGIDGNISWHKVDSEFNEFAIEQLKEQSTLIFGRLTYNVMYPYWATEGAIKDDPIVAKAMNEANKIVFSKTLTSTDWQNTKLVPEIDIQEITKLKENSQKDIFIFGSGQLVHEFEKYGLIDEYRLMIAPLTLGAGKPMFVDKLKFKLIKSREFKNGNLLVYYHKH